MKRTKDSITLASQMRRRVSAAPPKEPTIEYDGNMDHVISTGSTLLDLEISGGRIHGGGIPSGIMVEVFGPSGCGKTVLLCEIAGAVQRKGGRVDFKDPESRLNKQFAKMFDFDTDHMDYSTPNTVTDVFNSIRNLEPDNPNTVNGIFTDSLAALSTNLEMESDEGDKMGMKRAKEFSEGFRRTCRLLPVNNYLMVCSNQVRQNSNAGPYGAKYMSPGGEAIGFYSSLRLRCGSPQKIKDKKTVAGKEVKRVIGVTTVIEVFKSSVWKPYGMAPVTIIFDYGIDDIRQNLQFIKNFTSNTTYTVNGESLSNAMEEAISVVEEQKLTQDLKNEVIDLWTQINKKFKQNRKPKVRE